MRHLFTFLIFISFLEAAAQNSLVQDAENAYLQGNYAEAMDKYQEASAAHLQSNQQENYCKCNLMIAECQLALGEPDKALNTIKLTLDYATETLPDLTEIQAVSLTMAGKGYMAVGRNDLALDNLRKAEIMFETGSLNSAECYENLGVAYLNNGNKNLSLQYHEKALSIRKEASNDDQVLLADSYNNIGLIYSVEEPSKAIEYFNQALPIYEKNLGATHPKVAFCYSNLAFASAHRKKYFDAEKYLNEVDKIWNTTVEGDHPNKAFSLNNRGRILEMKGTFDEALITQQEALKMYLRLYGNKHPEVANTFFLIGSVYQKKDEFKAAANNYQQSIYANLFDQNFTSLYDLPEIRDYYNADILLTSLQAKAKALEAYHFTHSLKKRDIDGALNSYLKCDELISQIRQNRLNEADKLRLGEIAADVYDNGINTSLFLSNRTFKRKQYEKQAFDLCERSKAAILLESINETKAKSYAGIPDSELIIEDSLKSQISYLEQKLAKSKPGPDQTLIKNQLFSYQNSQRDFVDRLEKNYPQYFKLKYDQSLVSHVDLQKAISDNTAVISYFTGAQEIYAFVLTKKGLKIHEFQRENEFLKSATGLRNAIKYRVDAALHKTATAIYKQVIPTIPNGINSLIIIPDGVLGTIPFESLISSVDENGKPRYLIEDYAISYDYSATLLHDRITKELKSEAKGILLTAPVTFYDNEISMPPLPGTKNEVQEIRFLFAGTDHGVKSKTSTSASESMIKSSEVGQYKYIHFATHGMVNESKPELSRIFLAPDDQEDGSLYSGEIYNLKINADLVTLSACETGLGKIAKGEGIVGLSRALMYSGAENLVVSLWTVSDASTSQLMIEFYKQHLYHSENHLFADDLRQAKLSLLRGEKYTAPYYWAPFVLVGM